MNYPQREIKDICRIRTGGVLSRLKSTQGDNDGYKYKLVSLKSIDNKGRLRREYLEDFKSANRVNEEFITKKGDILVRLREPVTAVYINQEMEGILVSSLFGIVRSEEADINMKYICHFLNSDSARRQLSSYIKGSKIKMVKTTALGELKAAIPSYERQEKIIDLVDMQMQEMELIEQLKERKEILFREYKRRLFK